MHIVEVKFKGLPKQKEFVRAQDPECLYSGGVGGGKSLALCLKLVTRAAHPLAREFLGRLTLDDLKATTLKTLLEGDGGCPPVLPLGSYMHFKSERTIQLKGGGQIVYGGMDDRSSDPSRMKAGSRNLSGIAVDQAEELTADIYAKWSFRPRAVGEGLTRQVYLACNPAAPSHFLARRFGITGDEKAEGTFFILTNPMENPYLPADYIARLKTFTGVLYKRMVLGLWVASEGVVYDRWDRETHVQSRNGPWARVWLGIDDGVTNPFAALRVCEDSDGRLHVEREVYRRAMAEPEKVEACKGMMPWEAALPDPAAAGLKQALRRAGHTVIKADNDVLTGINEVQSRLLPGSDGRPRLTVDPSCVNTITEFESYEWTEGRAKDTPQKVNDHTADALRYVCSHRREQAAAAFDANTLRRLRSQCCPALYLGDVVNRLGAWDTEFDVKLKNHDGAIARFAEGEGPWRLWCDLDDTGRCSNEWPYVVAASVGSGLPGNPTVVKVGNAELKSVVAEAVLEGVAPEQAARVVMLAGLWFEGPSGRAKLIWSTSGSGVPFGETIRRMAYGRCYVMHEEGIAKPESSWAGWDWSRDGIQAIFGGWRNALAADRYIEKSVLTADDCARWIFNSGGVLAPATLDADGQRAQDPSDRAMSGMLLSHAMEFYKPSDRPTHKAQPFSIDWLLEREKRQKQQASRWSFVRSRGSKPDDV